MSTTPPTAPPPTDSSGTGGEQPDGPRVGRDHMRDLGRLRRTVGDRHIAGVGGGLARHFDVDPIIVRVALVVLVFFGGAGLIIYAACWLLVPEEGAPDAPLHLDDRNRGIALILAFAFAALSLLGDSLGGWWFPWPLAIIALVVYLLLTSRRSSRAGEAPPGTPSGPPSGAGYSYSYEYEYGGPGADPRTVVRSVVTRKRGPILFWLTLAVIAVALGVVAMIDLAGVDVVDSAYPATALAVTGLMLVFGAFWGRAGGLILLGLIALLATVGATVGGEVDGRGRIDARPITAAQVQDSYDLFAGEIELDLSDVDDVAALDGRTIRADLTFGRIDITLPEGVDANVDARVDAGHTVVFGDEDGGSQEDVEYDPEVDVDRPTVTIVAETVFGEIEVDSVERTS